MAQARSGENSTSLLAARTAVYDTLMAMKQNLQVQGIDTTLPVGASASLRLEHITALHHALTISKNMLLFEKYSTTLIHELGKQFQQLAEDDQTFLEGIQELATSVHENLDDYQQFQKWLAIPLNTLAFDLFDANKNKEQKTASLTAFRNSANSYLASFSVDNELTQRRFKILTGIITAAAIMIGAAIVAAVGVGVTIASGGTLTLPYIGAVGALVTGITGGTIGGILSGTAALMTRYCFFKPVEKHAGPAVKHWLDAIDTAASDALGM